MYTPDLAPFESTGEGGGSAWWKNPKSGITEGRDMVQNDNESGFSPCA